MKNKIINHVVTKLVCDDIIEESDREIYQYGLQQCLATCFNWVCTIAIGIWFKMLWESVFFIIVFIPLRTYVGGYHAKTQLLCHVYSVLVIVIVMELIKNLNFSLAYDIPLAILCAFAIGTITPVESKNKKLSVGEKKKYKKKSMIVLGIEIVILFLGIVFEKKIIANLITLNLIVVSILALMGYICRQEENI